jgi:hypothetical protein
MVTRSPSTPTTLTSVFIVSSSLDTRWMELPGVRLMSCTGSNLACENGPARRSFRLHCPRKIPARNPSGGKKEKDAWARR